ncbi:hypothetical protein ABT116_43805, partial [Streptomyces sp. NPDC002130]
MSLRPRLPGEVPVQTAEVARLAFPKGCLCMRIREALGPLFADEDFVELFPQRHSGSAGANHSCGMALLSDRNLLLLFVGQGVSRLGDGLYTAAV